MVALEERKEGSAASTAATSSGSGGSSGGLNSGPPSGGRHGGRASTWIPTRLELKIWREYDDVKGAGHWDGRGGAWRNSKR